MEQQELPIEREREWGRGGRWGMEKTEEERKQSSGTQLVSDGVATWTQGDGLRSLIFPAALESGLEAFDILHDTPAPGQPLHSLYSSKACPLPSPCPPPAVAMGPLHTPSSADYALPSSRSEGNSSQMLNQECHPWSPPGDQTSLGRLPGSRELLPHTTHPSTTSRWSR